MASYYSFENVLDNEIKGKTYISSKNSIDSNILTQSSIYNDESGKKSMNDSNIFYDNAVDGYTSRERKLRDYTSVDKKYLKNLYPTMKRGTMKGLSELNLKEVSSKFKCERIVKDSKESKRKKPKRIEEYIRIEL